MNKLQVTVIYNNGTERVYFCRVLRVQGSSPISKAPDMLVLYGETKTESISLTEVGYFYAEAIA